MQKSSKSFENIQDKEIYTGKSDLAQVNHAQTTKSNTSNVFDRQTISCKYTFNEVLVC